MEIQTYKTSAKLKSYKDLIVWQKSMLLVTKVFELYGIISQIRKAAVSIPSNIAEGWGRKSNKEYRQFYAIAYGSVLELETQLLISQNLKFGDSFKYEAAYSLLVEVSKMLHVMAFDLKTKNYDLSTKI